MPLTVIGAGVGRTGTYSLKLALNQLGVGPCHHMEEVLHQMPVQVPLWCDAVAGRADWEAIYDGYGSAVDWPTAGFFGELYAAYPTAKFILTLREPARWVESFSETIYRLLSGREMVPAEMLDWFDMAKAVIDRTGFPDGLDAAGLAKAFEAHNQAVRAGIPASQLLEFDVKQGWSPLCDFLGLAVPAEPFPRTNDRTEFWDRVAGKA
ncbi:MAG: sulfotransferase family protein [Anderseniella sp.]|jgi:hypothetical protein|nr:sulfotransferase family protein [Anderseniella sp.]